VHRTQEDKDILWSARPIIALAVPLPVTIYLVMRARCMSCIMMPPLAMAFHESANIYNESPLYERGCVTTPSPPLLCRCLFNRAVLLEREGHSAEAEDMQRSCLEMRERVLGPEHLQVRLLPALLTAQLSCLHPADSAERSGSGKFGGCGRRR
jgi:hypothetical protein